MSSCLLERADMLRGLFGDSDNLKMYFQADFQIEGWGAAHASRVVLYWIHYLSRHVWVYEVSKANTKYSVQ